MITWAVRAAISFVVLAIVLYFVFLVPLGERTLYEHVRRIASTEEAQDLGEEVGEAGERLSEELERRAREAARDAGLPEAPTLPTP